MKTQSSTAAQKYEPVTFTHLTLHTGHITEQSEFIPEVPLRDMLMSITYDGVHTLPDGYRIMVSRFHPWHVCFSVGVYDSTFCPLVFCHACLDPDHLDETWDKVMEIMRSTASYAAGRLPAPMHYFFETPFLKRPQTPFLAVAITPMCALEAKALFWLGDFERCLYWALWNRNKVTPNLKTAHVN